jgi:cell division protein FtsQ
MKKGLKITLTATAFCLILLVFIAGCGMNGKRLSQLTCAGVKVEFTDDFNFVTAKDVEGYLEKGYGNYIGQRLDSVDLMKVEKVLDSKSAILKAEAYTTPDGYLNIRISQREPVVRFQKGDNGYYADERGFLFPLQSNYSSRVLIVDGNLPLDVTRGYKGEPKTEKEREWLAGVLGLVDYMKKTKIWEENICQITVGDGGDLVLVPREGKEKFLFGQPEDVERKFSLIDRYYTTIRPQKEEGRYSTVNVKYNGQIVCRK